jgi:Arc/MetJ-type ribon-helix-helix transcriptional regulator
MSATEKKSYSIDRAELRWLSSYSKKKRISASSVVTRALRMLREEETARAARERAVRAFLGTYSPEEHATPEERKALLKKWRG